MRRRPRFNCCGSSTATVLLIAAAAFAALTPSFPRTHAWAFVGAPLVASDYSSIRLQQRGKPGRSRSKLATIPRYSKFSIIGRLAVTRQRTGSCSMTTSSGGGGSDASLAQEAQEEHGEAERDPFVRVTLAKPLGVQFEEIRAGFPGLMVSDVLEGGSAIENGVSLFHEKSPQVCTRHLIYIDCLLLVVVDCFGGFGDTGRTKEEWKIHVLFFSALVGPRFKD